MPSGRALLVALALLAILSVALSFANVSAGDAGGGGGHDIIKALFI